MPRKAVYAPDWEPYSRIMKLRLTCSQTVALDALAADHGVSRSWLVREALATGVPLLVANLERARKQGVTPRALRRPDRVGKLFRGPMGHSPGLRSFAAKAPGALVDRRSGQYPVDDEY